MFVMVKCNSRRLHRNTSGKMEKCKTKSEEEEEEEEEEKLTCIRVSLQQFVHINSYGVTNLLVVIFNSCQPFLCNFRRLAEITNMPTNLTCSVCAHCQ